MACGNLTLEPGAASVGDRCRSPGGGWSCPAGCVETAGAAPFCRALSDFRCAGPCRAASESPAGGCFSAGRTYEEDLRLEAQTHSFSACQQRCRDAAGCAFFSWREGTCRLHGKDASFIAGASHVSGPASCRPSDQQAALAQLVPLDALPLVVRGSYLLDQRQQRRTLACVNWYGAHMEMLVNNGLNVMSLAEVAYSIVDLQFNCVRLPYSLDFLNLTSEDIPGKDQSLCHNPELQALTPLEIFDAKVQALTDAGLVVILNNHVSHRGWCCSADDGEGLWYTKTFTEAQWLAHLGMLTRRYRTNPRVVGFDIRNEIRSGAEGVPIWAPPSAAEDEKENWAVAAKKGSLEVLAANSDMLVIVSALEYSMYLCDVPRYPLHMEPALQGRLIYTAHEYDWYLSPAQTLQESVRVANIVELALLLLSIAMALACAPKFGRLRFGKSWAKQAVLAMVCVSSFLCAELALPELVGPCGQVPSEVVVSGALFLLWLPGAFFTVRLPWLLLLQLRARQEVPSSAPSSPLPTPKDTEAAPDRLGVHGEMQAMYVEGPPEVEAPRGHQPPWRLFASRSRATLVLAMIFVFSANLAVLIHLTSYEAWRSHLDSRWGFLLKSEEHRADVAAVWLGEFGHRLLVVA
ncbi:unnamed protein product [Effrenium voratum]|nr:unnamed protein product [Effrenium voratum]